MTPPTLPRPQCVDEIRLLDDGSSGGVDDQDAVFHLGKFLITSLVVNMRRRGSKRDATYLGRDEMPRLGRERAVERDDVALGKELVKGAVLAACFLFQKHREGSQRRKERAGGREEGRGKERPTLG